MIPHRHVCAARRMAPNLWGAYGCSEPRLGEDEPFGFLTIGASGTVGIMPAPGILSRDGPCPPYTLLMPSGAAAMAALLAQGDAVWATGGAPTGDGRDLIGALLGEAA